MRFAPLRLPWEVSKFGGSALWALALYWILSSLLPWMRLTRVALLTGLLTTAVECFKLYHAPELDAFRLTLAGRLLLGRIFSPGTIVFYWLAVVMGALIDHKLRPVANR